MKLLFVLENFTVGGVERVTLQLIKGLVQSYQCNIEVSCQSMVGPLLDDFDSLVEVSCTAASHRTFKQHSADFQPDVVIFTKGGLSRLGLGLSSQCKMVAIQHVPIELPEKNKVVNLVRRLAASLLYRRMDRIVCVSDGILNNLVQLKVCSKKNALRIYNPVLSDDIQQLANEEQHEYQDYYVCVGRLHYQKGYDLLIDSVIKLNNPNCKVVIIGDGPDRDDLEALVHHKGLQRQIIFHGMTTNPYKFIKHAKAILLTSRWEGLPTVLVEASYLKTPIVTFDCRYGPDELTQFGKYGHLVPFGDTELFAKCIQQIEQGKGKHSVDVSNFTLTSAVKNYYNLFNSL
ncbi:glycosyltransferase [Pseudoalteromonas byunsanensis]|uniref:Glycosyl transferase n=1 Tax=Pseudoalteromonas byunsanensis TaxID=327939 RepID=A0A1S1N6I8_9GAMM|nr:glycosyltransferase [Pseudoalteromonas byunsanensis]OHU95282.1 hypothetical protein BIW53_11220 [Pseudoalteromonas byunsanensis]